MTGAGAVCSDPARRRERLAVAALAVVTALCAALFAQALARGFVFETDLQALLPQRAGAALEQAAGERLFAHGGDRLVLAVGADDAELALRAAGDAQAALRQSPLLDVDTLSPATQAAQGAQLLDLWWRHRFQLLDPAQRAQLAAGGAGLQRRAERDLYDPKAWGRLSAVEDDPLNLFEQFRRSLPTGPSGAVLRGDHWVVETPLEPGRHYVLLPAAMTDSALKLAAQRQLVAFVEGIAQRVSEAYPGVEVLRSGIVFHADRAAQTARAEISLIGGGSALGIVALFLLAFGSPRPLLLSLCSVAFGSWCAVSVCQWLFGELHLLTLVFGASLIGVAIDYPLHYFTRLHSRRAPCGRRRALQAILPALCMGLATTLLGYGSLAQAPLPGLRQVACFSVIGLLGAWQFTVAVLPLAAARARRPYPAALARVAELPTRLWQRVGAAPARRALAALALVGAVTCAAALKTSDDVRTLYRPDPALIQQEQRVGALVGNYSPNQFLLVTGASAEDLLQREEALQQRLNQLHSDGAIAGWSAISQYLPSQQRQRENHALLERVVYGEDGAAYALLSRLGFESATALALSQRFARSRGDYLLPEEFLAAAPPPLQLLWLGARQGSWASMIALRGVADLATLRQAALAAGPGVVFVDRVAAISALLQHQSQQAALLLLVAYGGICLLLRWRYRSWAALRLVLAPALASLLTLTLLAAAGTPLTLFHLFALFLVLGLGMDYSLFIADAGQRDPDTLVAIALSAATSGLSFGLLALSSTPMVQAFGVTVLLGSAFNLLLAPLLAVRPGAPAR